ncbi:hypothetical protein M199_gp177 [Halogranum tailed virus 1]|uniref:Uncharacterized protein n=1 Tax=Halogranum tailed virus 1 TaxID=1273749 RepID=R4T700_9CAUD|nr:hypothetical protein M199_gp177 [Halogranum tailed virus 1]AGM11489.1 hypothetical protein HGTV1_192 [Halogranum tailed virus 1]
MRVRKEREAWRTYDFGVYGGKPVALQQKWALYSVKEQETKPAHRGRNIAISTDLEAFPTDEWRVVDMRELVDYDFLDS